MRPLQNKRLLLGGLFILALLVRIIVLTITVDKPFMTGISSGSIETAKYLAEGKGFISSDLKPANYDLPGYGVFLSIPVIFFGLSIGLKVAMGIQLLLSAFGVFLCFAIGKRLFGQTAGLIFAFFWAINLSEAVLSSYILHDALMPFLALLATYFFVKGITDQKKSNFWWSAVCIGIASTMRSDLLLLPIFFFLALLVWNFHDWKNHLRTFIIMSVIVFLAVLPWGVRNYIQFGKFSLTRTVLWQAIWEGFGEFPNPYGAVLDDSATFYQISAEVGKKVIPHDEFEQALKKKTLQALKSDPWWYISMLPRRFARMVLIGGYSSVSGLMPTQEKFGFQVYKLHHPGEGLFQYIEFLLKEKPSEFFLRITPMLYRGVFLLLAFWGVLFWRHEWKALLAVTAIYTYGIFSHLPIYWEPRYLIPNEFPVLLLAALGIISISQKLTSR